MTILILGLVLFLGIHSTRIFAEDARSRFIAARGAGAWKGLYALVSAVGLAAIIWGFAAARSQPLVLWPRLPGMAHLAALLTLFAFMLMVAAYVPGNLLKARLHHPMVLSVKLWAAAHLLANNTLADVLLFGGFLVWAILCFRAARQRDRVAGTVYPPGRFWPTLITLVLGALAWAGFALVVHAAWLGVRPLG
ncbi:NnrU family protein [Paucibacter sp. KCTC 42545]|uniref:NnrU family protein n=1 Tax=Paucibacter sp. KCTC 42545 TaxID=1768242 RepID=UPI000733B972|nr:NnrU family protein [Paucibacter sp. KCTC 42545]ALT78584.1 NnrU [Paucibacter sp. KCTC 42545]